VRKIVRKSVKNNAEERKKLLDTITVLATHLYEDELTHAFNEMFSEIRELALLLRHNSLGPNLALLFPEATLLAIHINNTGLEGHFFVPRFHPRSLEIHVSSVGSCYVELDQLYYPLGCNDRVISPFAVGYRAKTRVGHVREALLEPHDLHDLQCNNSKTMLRFLTYANCSHYVVGFPHLEHIPGHSSASGVGIPMWNSPHIQPEDILENALNILTEEEKRRDPLTVLNTVAGQHDPGLIVAGVALALHGVYALAALMILLLKMILRNRADQQISEPE
jgi:hypothetical protein